MSGLSSVEQYFDDDTDPLIRYAHRRVTDSNAYYDKASKKERAAIRERANQLKRAAARQEAARDLLRREHLDNVRSRLKANGLSAGQIRAVLSGAKNVIEHFDPPPTPSVWDDSIPLTQRLATAATNIYDNPLARIGAQVGTSLLPGGILIPAAQGYYEGGWQGAAKRAGVGLAIQGGLGLATGNYSGLANFVNPLGAAQGIYNGAIVGKMALEYGQEAAKNAQYYGSLVAQGLSTFKDQAQYWTGIASGLPGNVYSTALTAGSAITGGLTGLAETASNYLSAGATGAGGLASAIGGTATEQAGNIYQSVLTGTSGIYNALPTQLPGNPLGYLSGGATALDTAIRSGISSVPSGIATAAGSAATGISTAVSNVLPSKSWH